MRGNCLSNCMEVPAQDTGRQSSIFIQTLHGLLGGTTYFPLNTHTEKTNKLALKTVSKIRVEHFQKLHTVSSLSDDNPTLTPSDVIQASCSSFSGRIFSEPLKKLDQMLNFGPGPYTNFCRFFLCLPPAITIGEARPQPG